MKTETKLFAFKLAEKKQEVTADTKWKAREGVATAGCSGRDARGHGRWGRDTGMLC